LIDSGFTAEVPHKDPKKSPCNQALKAIKEIR